MAINNYPAYDKRKKRLFKNWYYLTILQAAQYVMPFIPIPYLVRVLSPDKFGLVAFAIAVSQFFAVFVEYGFSYSAVKRIAVNRNDNDKIAEIYSTTIIIKALIFLAMAAVFVPALLFAPKISGEKLVFGFAFLMVFSDIFFTAWFFQGLERMRYIAYLNLIMGILYVASVFVFIKNADDYYLVPLLESLSSLIAGLVSVWIIYKVFKVKFKFQPFERVIYYFKRGWHYFVSDFASNAYMSASVFILGFIAGNAAVGYYRAALSILIPIKSLFEPVVHAAYPYMSKTAEESKEKAVTFLKTYSFSVAAVSFLLSAKLFFGADFIVRIFLGQEYAESAALVKIISIVPFLYTLNMIFSMHVMYPFEMKANFAKITAFSAIISFALIPVLALPFKDAGMAVIMVIGELCISVMAFRQIKAKGFIFSKNV